MFNKNKKNAPKKKSLLSKIFNKKVVIGLVILGAFATGNITKPYVDKSLKKTWKQVVSLYKTGTKKLEKNIPDLKR